MPVKNEKAFAHIRLKNNLARRLRKIAFINHRRGIQMEVELAVIDYVHKHEVLTNRRDNGR